MTSYKIMLFLHVASVIVTLGATFAYPFMQAFAEKTSTGATRFMLQFALRMDRILVFPGLILLGLFGIGLIFDDATGYSDDLPAWLVIAVFWYLVAAFVAVRILRPMTFAALATLEGTQDDAPLPAAYEPYSKKIQQVGGMLGFSIIAIAFLMTYKPGQ